MSVFIGTSGFSYPYWQGEFYPSDLPQGEWFSYYVKHFNTVELNVSFYRLPKKETFVNWRAKAGPGFVFAVKGSRFITHVKKLRNCQEPLKRFFEAASGLMDTSEVVLWQLPPKFRADSERLVEFLKLLPRDWRHAFEFRHESWLKEAIYDILTQHNSAVVFQDFPDWPMSEEITADFIYLRFHGKTALYSSCYTKKELTAWAQKIKTWREKGLDCYAYFNNDALGYAVENTRELIAGLKAQSAKPQGKT